MYRKTYNKKELARLRGQTIKSEERNMRELFLLREQARDALASFLALQWYFNTAVSKHFSFQPEIKRNFPASALIEEEGKVTSSLYQRDITVVAGAPVHEDDQDSERFLSAFFRLLEGAAT